MDQPIACTLGATQYEDRTRELTALAERALRSRRADRETVNGSCSPTAPRSSASCAP